MTASYRKITISVPADLLDYADRRAGATQRSRSEVISEALAVVQEWEREHLAEEGYRFYAGEASEFAEGSAGAVTEALLASQGREAADASQAW